MSIAALKKKTFNNNPRLAPLSGNNGMPFSINGTRRNVRVVGPTNLGRYVNKNGETCCTPDTNTIMPTVKNTQGMLSVRYNGLKCSSDTCPKTWVQPIDSGYNKHNTQEQYIIEKSINCNTVHKTKYGENNEIKDCHKNCRHHYVGTKKVAIHNYAKKGLATVSQSEYIKNRRYNNRIAKQDSTCGNPYKPPFPPNVNNKGCNTYYKTYEEAKAAGLY